MGLWQRSGLLTCCVSIPPGPLPHHSSCTREPNSPPCPVPRSKYGGKNSCHKLEKARMTSLLCHNQNPSLADVLEFLLGFNTGVLKMKASMEDMESQQSRKRGLPQGTGQDRGSIAACVCVGGRGEGACAKEVIAPLKSRCLLTAYRQIIYRGPQGETGVQLVPIGLEDTL